MAIKLSLINKINTQYKRGKSRKRLFSRLSVSMALLLLLLIFSCARQNSDNAEMKNILLEFKGDELALNEVIDRIPPNMAPADSMALFKEIVDNWLKEKMLTDLAKENIGNYGEIEKKVENYRKKLILNEYLSTLRSRGEIKISEDSLKSFYENHHDELLTEVPLVKGIFIKVPTVMENKEQIKNLLQLCDANSIDELEANYMNGLSAYEYFGDKWVNWNVIEDILPYRFNNPDEFLSHNKIFETSYNDCTYILRITDYLPSGSVQPYEFVESWLPEFLERRELSKYEDKLMESLLDDAMKEKTIKFIGYDPVTKSVKAN